MTEIRDARYGIPTERQPNMIVSKFLEYLTGPDNTEFHGHIAKLEHHADPDRYPKSQSILVIYVNWGVCCLRLLNDAIASELGHFPIDEVDSMQNKHEVLGFSHEDWHRALMFLRWYFKETSAKRGTTGKRAASAEKDIAVLPHYLHDSDLADIDDEEDELVEAGQNDGNIALKAERRAFRQARREFEDFFKQSDSEEEDFDDIYKPKPTATEDRDLLSHTKTLEKTLARSTATNARSGPTNSRKVARPKLSSTEISQFSTDVLNSTKIVWGEKEVTEMRLKAHESLFGNNLALGDIVELGKLMGSEGEDGNTGAADKEETDDADVDKATEASKRKQQELVWALRETMNSTSAQLPSFKEACKWAGIDPSDLSIKEAPVAVGEQAPSYKPHQIPCELPFPIYLSQIYTPLDLVQ